MAILYRVTDGPREEEIKPANGKTFVLEELQKLVGGYIEIVDAGAYNWHLRGKIFVINEEGKLLSLAHNPRASELFSSPFDYLAGDVLLCNSDEVD